MSLPKFKNKINDYLSSEDGIILNKKMLVLSGIALTSSVSLLSMSAVGDHASHCSGGSVTVNSKSYGCLSEGLAGFAGVSQHSTHGTHGSHVSHGTHGSHVSHVNHGSHASHSTHGTHGSHGTHTTHCTHGSHGSHGTHSSHGSGW